MASTRIGFLGLGIMGRGMAARLLAAGFEVSVFNRDRTKAAALEASGARIARTPGDAAKDADIVFSMVADDVASRVVWLGENGAVTKARRGAVLVECSTLTVAWVRELAAAVSAGGRVFVDAPVTGSKAAAQGGELNFVVGGTTDAVSVISPALKAMGRSISHVGPVGAGALTKLVNNFLAGVQVAAFGEALAWLERSGIDREKALAFLLEGAAASPVTKVVATRMVTGDFTPNFLLRLMAKDLGYAMAEASAVDQSLSTAGIALERFRDAIALNHGEKDMAAVVLPMRNPAS